MARVAVVLSAALAACAALAADDPGKPAKPAVEPVSLVVSRKLDEKNYAYSTSGTALSVKVSCPGKQVLGVDSASSVSEFADDKGTSLLKGGLIKPTFSNYPIVATDRASLVVSVQSTVPPGKGAARLHLKGDLVLRCGLQEKATEEKEVEFKGKAEAKLGDFTLKVTQEKGFGGGGASFTLTAPRPVLKSVTVKDAAGKAVEVMTLGSFGFGKTWTYTFSLRKPLKQGKVTVSFFAKEEKLTVPVDLSVGLGL
jgi:hypothetical protein